MQGQSCPETGILITGKWEVTKMWKNVLANSLLGSEQQWYFILLFCMYSSHYFHSHMHAWREQS